MSPYLYFSCLVGVVVELPLELGVGHESFTGVVVKHGNGNGMTEIWHKMLKHRIS